MGEYRRAVLAAATWCVVGAGFAAEPVCGSEAMDAPLRQRLQRLEAQVEVLRAETDGRRWLTERRAEEIRALTRDVLADADRRRCLADRGLTAGRDRFFFIASPDGNFKLNFLGMVQTRFVLSIQDDGTVEDSTRSGFENSRTRFGVLGHVGDPSWKFGVWGGWLSSGRSWLVESWIRKDFGNGWVFDFGHFKLPTSHEWIIKEFHQQFIERSLLNARWTGAGKGIRACYNGERIHVLTAVTDGAMTWNRPWSTGPDSTFGPLPWQMSSEFALTGRVEWLLNGSWTSRYDFESFPGDEGNIVLGAAAHYQVGEYGTADDENDVVQWVVDATGEFGGGSVFVAGFGTHFENSTADRDEWGLLAQGGVFLDEHWELIGRLEYGDLDGAGSVSDDLLLLTVGVNRFWNRHGLKWMADLGYAFEPVDAAWGGAGAGWRADEAGGEGQIVLRTQLQLLF